jgi:carbamoyltransferase
MQSKLNLKIKYRESFRPFAPAVLAERATDYFQIDVESPYMLFVAPVNDEVRVSGGPGSTTVRSRIQETRSTIPAVTHVDYSARLQTVQADVNPAFHSILKAFDELTGCAVLVNTSFNVRGEPIVCNPEDAYECFMNTEMDVLILENFMLVKSEQPQDHVRPAREGSQWLD